MTPADPPDIGEHPVAANDNGDVGGSDPEALRKVNEVVLQLARIIGRRMAREDFAALAAANDNQRSKRHADSQEDRSGDDADR